MIKVQTPKQGIHSHSFSGPCLLLPTYFLPQYSLLLCLPARWNCFYIFEGTLIFYSSMPELLLQPQISFLIENLAKLLNLKDIVETCKTSTSAPYQVELINVFLYPSLLLYTSIRYIHKIRIMPFFIHTSVFLCMTSQYQFSLSSTLIRLS